MTDPKATAEHFWHWWWFNFAYLPAFKALQAHRREKGDRNG